MFDWNLAIERNAAALTNIVAGLFGLVRAAGSSSSGARSANRGSSSEAPSHNRQNTTTGQGHGSGSRNKSGMTLARDCANPTPSPLCLSQESMPEGSQQVLNHRTIVAAAGMDPCDRHRGDKKGETEDDELGRYCASHPHPELVEGRGCDGIGHKHRLNLTSILRAAEAALRRLIMLYVIAKGIKARVSAKRDDRPLPDFASFKRAENPLPKFNLIDPRPPLVITWVDDQGTPLRGRANKCDEHLCQPVNARSADAEQEENQSDQTLRQAQGEDASHFNPTNFLARLQALDHALNNLPQEAKRMAREIEKRKRLRTLPLTEDKPLRGSWANPPIRVGKPPGHRNRGDHEVDDILKECHGLFRDIESSPP